MTQNLLIIIRATGIACGYAFTLGFLYAARLFWWIVQAPNSGTSTSRFQLTAEAVLHTSPYIILSSILFAFLAAPLASWSIGSASWNSLKRYIYGFWSVLALLTVASGNADVLILISGAGLIALWFLRNRGGLNLARTHSKDGVGVRMPLQSADSRHNITVFAILAMIACVLSLFLFFGNGMKRYVGEILAIYAVAAICQGFKTFAVIGQNASPEITT